MYSKQDIIQFANLVAEEEGSPAQKESYKEFILKFFMANRKVPTIEEKFNWWLKHK